MTFSFRSGISWYHNFPKLARESGFYFNTHSSRVRVDWSRIAEIDIDRVIRERDYQTVDDNVNNVVDYKIDSEHDSKILDPNFVKLFRLAQLAIEYLLYCKQYLDQSVVILKEELKSKVQENSKLKQDITSLESSLKELKQQLKGAKSNITNEVYKCPHCPKTFVSPGFAKAHIVRRHSNLTELLTTSGGIDEDYKTETEKLHNEIKTLKERINQTERVIRTESKDCREIPSFKQNNNNEEQSEQQDDQFKKYQEELNNLKAVFFNEIKNLKQLDSQQQKSISNENIKQVISEQEKQIDQLKLQVQEIVKSKTYEVETKLKQQEEYWKSKVGDVEKQHQSDIQNLFSQLKLAQEAANDLKKDYENKILSLEKKCESQKEILTAQSERIDNLAIKKSTENFSIKNTENVLNQSKCIADFNSDNESGHSSEVYIPKEVPKSINKINNTDSHQDTSTDDQVKKRSRDMVKKSTSEKLWVTSNKKTQRIPESNKHSKTPHTDLTNKENKKTQQQLTNQKTIDIVTEEHESSYSSTNSESSSINESENHVNKLTPDDTFTEQIVNKDGFLTTLENKLKDLGIDPEWCRIPLATFKEKMVKLQHQQNISSRKNPTYYQVKKQILDDLSKKIQTRRQSDDSLRSKKVIKSIKSKTMKTLNDIKLSKGKHKISQKTPEVHKTSPELNLEILPKKLTLSRNTLSNLNSMSKNSRNQEENRSFPDSPLNPNDIHENSECSINSDDECSKKVIKPSQYYSIKDFMRDVTDPPKLHLSKKELTSNTRHRNNAEDGILSNSDEKHFQRDTEGIISSPEVKHIEEDVSQKNLSIISSITKNIQESLGSTLSPKNNRGVLKTTTGPISNSIKKRVFFDLEEKTEEKDHFSKVQLSDSNIEKNTTDFSYDQNKPLSMSSAVNLNRLRNNRESPFSSTLQRDRIAEISRQIQEKLESTRRKPAGAIEVMHSEISQIAENQKKIADHLGSPVHHSDLRPEDIKYFPKPAPRISQGKQLF